MMKVKCRICGEKFEAKSVAHKYCSNECRKKSMKQEERDKRADEKKAMRKKEAPTLSIDDVLKIARKHGILYGKAVQLIEAGLIS
ncbi:MAG: hypothetical protein E7473_06255 [Ruminococcaceae bacterium]|nr:hypothetical protein [Oscillospiraceae bacterium]